MLVSMPAYRFHSIEPEGVWTSEPFPSAERRHIVQGVIAGFLSGHPRWATELDGTFIYGLDAKGKEIKSAPTAARRGHATKKSPPQAMKSQRGMMDEASRRIAEANETFLEMLPTMRRKDLERLIEKRPALWGRFAGYLTSGHVFVDDPPSGRAHATKKSAAQLDREIAEALGQFPYDEPELRAKWVVQPSDLRVGQRFDYFGKPYEITKIGRDKAKTVQIARRYKDPFGKEELIEYRSFPMRAFYQQHLRPLR